MRSKIAKCPLPTQKLVQLTNSLHSAMYFNLIWIIIRLKKHKNENHNRKKVKIQHLKKEETIMSNGYHKIMSSISSLISM